MQIIEAAASLSVGFFVYTILTKPRFLKNKMPHFSVKTLEIFPSLKINTKKLTIWIHHWIWLSFFLGFLNHIAHGLESLILLKFFALGGIIQGLSFKDRFRVFFKTLDGQHSPNTFERQEVFE